MECARPDGPLRAAAVAEAMAAKTAPTKYTAPELLLGRGLLFRFVDCLRPVAFEQPGE